MKRVLVIDDEETLLSVMNHVLVRAGYASITVSSAQGGIDMLSTTEIDLILTDLVLPGILGGLDVIRASKAQNPSRPVVVISGHTGTGVIEEALVAGADEFFPKPFSAGQLRDLVRKYLGDPPSPAA